MRNKAFTVYSLILSAGAIIMLAGVLMLAGCDDKPSTSQQAKPSPQPTSKPAFTIPNATWVVRDSVLKFPSVHRSGEKVFDGCLQRWQEKHPEYEVVSMSSQPGDGEWVIYTYVTIKRKQQ